MRSFGAIAKASSRDWDVALNIYGAPRSTDLIDPQGRREGRRDDMDRSEIRTFSNKGHPHY